MFFITWFSSTIHVKVDLLVLVMYFLCSIKVDIYNLPLIFSVFKSFERFWICRFFRFGFGYAGFSDLEELWDDLLVSRLKYNALGDFQDNLPGSLLTESSHMSPFHNRFERFGKFLCLIFLHLVTSCCIKFLPFSQTKTLHTHSNLFYLKTPNFIWIFHFCLMFFSLIYLLVACFNQMVLIFPLDMYFVCSINVDLYNLPLIFSVFKSFKHFFDTQVFQIWSRFWKIYGKSSRKSSKI